MASLGRFSLSDGLTGSLTYSICFSTTISESSLNVTLTLPSKSPEFSVVLVFGSLASVTVAPSRYSLILALSVAESFALTPCFQSTVSPTHFLRSTGSRPPRASTFSAFVSSTVKVPGSDVSGVVSPSATPPLSVTVAVTSVPPFTLSLGIVTTPFLSTEPSPSVIDQVSFLSFVAVVVFVLPSFPV